MEVEEGRLRQGELFDLMTRHQCLQHGHESFAFTSIHVPKKMCIVLVRQCGQLRYQRGSARRERNHLFAQAAFRQFSLRKAFFFEPRDDLGCRAFGHAESPDELRMRRFRVIEERAQCDPFGNRHAFGFQELPEARGHMVGYETQPISQVGFQLAGFESG